MVGHPVAALVRGRRAGGECHAGRCQPARRVVRVPVGAGDLGLGGTGLPVGRHHRAEHAGLPPGAGRRARGSCAAFRTVAWHETVLVAVLGALAYAAWGAANPFALWTFALLFCARVSAKLNLYLGVPFINTSLPAQPACASGQLLPPRPGQRVFPGFRHASGAGVRLFPERLWRAHQAGDMGDIIGFTLLSMLAPSRFWNIGSWSGACKTTNSGAGCFRRRQMTRQKPETRPRGSQNGLRRPFQGHVGHAERRRQLPHLCRGGAPMRQLSQGPAFQRR